MKGKTRPRKKGSKQPKPYWKRVEVDKDRERWVHPATIKKAALYGTAGIAGGILGYFLPSFLYGLVAQSVLGFIKDNARVIKDSFQI